MCEFAVEVINLIPCMSAFSDKIVYRFVGLSVGTGLVPFGIAGSCSPLSACGRKEAERYEASLDCHGEIHFRPDSLHRIASTYDLTRHILTVLHCHTCSERPRYNQCRCQTFLLLTNNWLTSRRARRRLSTSASCASAWRT